MTTNPHEPEEGNTRLVYLGIDPGKQGGIAAIDDTGGVHLIPVPEGEHDLWELISGYAPAHLETPGRTRAVIERVGGFMRVGSKKEGTQKNMGSGHTMFTFGQSYGSLRMALVAAGIPFEDMLPQAWQKSLGITPRKKGETKGQWKNRLKFKARCLYPEVAGITAKTADALLLAEVCRRIHGVKTTQDGK